MQLFFFPSVFSPTRWRGLTSDMAPDIGQTTTANIHYKHMVGTEGGVLIQSTFLYGGYAYNEYLLISFKSLLYTPNRLSGKRFKIYLFNTVAETSRDSEPKKP